MAKSPLRKPLTPQSLRARLCKKDRFPILRRSKPPTSHIGFRGTKSDDQMQDALAIISLQIALAWNRIAGWMRVVHGQDFGSARSHGFMSGQHAPRFRFVLCGRGESVDERVMFGHMANAIFYRTRKNAAALGRQLRASVKNHLFENRRGDRKSEPFVHRNVPTMAIMLIPRARNMIKSTMPIRMPPSAIAIGC